MRRLALVLPVLPLLLTACSSGDDDARAAYVEQAEQVCTSANEELAALTQPTGITDVADYTTAVVDLLEGSVQDVAAIEPPEQDRAELTEKVLDPFAADVQVARDYEADIREAAEAGEAAAVLTLVREVPNTSADLDYMREYGLVECAKAADTSD